MYSKFKQVFQSTWDLVASAYSNCKPPTNSQIADVSRMCRFGKVPMPHELKPSKHSKGMRELVDCRSTNGQGVDQMNQFQFTET